MSDQDPTTRTPAGAGAKPLEEPPNAMVHVPPAAAEPEPEPEVVDGEPVPDVDLDLDAFRTAKTRLGGRPFLAKEPSIETQMATIRSAAGDDEPEGESEATIDDALQTLKTLESIYPQVREVLFHADGDEQGQPPSREFVQQHLRLSTFRALFRHLLGTRAEGNDA